MHPAILDTWKRWKTRQSWLSPSYRRLPQHDLLYLVEWLDACGHSGHLEKAEDVAKLAVPFLQKTSAA